LNEDNKKGQLVHQHNRKLKRKKNESYKSRKEQKIENENDEDNYSQGSSDEENGHHVSDPDDDSEPTTNDDEETIADRRNWRRKGYRLYRLDNPTSILIEQRTTTAATNEAATELIVLNEGVFTRIKVAMEESVPFVQGMSQNIFCGDFPIFQEKLTRTGVQAWSIAKLPDSSSDYVFSLLDGPELYLLKTNAIELFTKTPIEICPYLIYHSKLNLIFAYESKQILTITNEGIVEKSRLFEKYIDDQKIISMTFDGEGMIYILIQYTRLDIDQYSILKFDQKVEFIEKIKSNQSHYKIITHMVVSSDGRTFYFSDYDDGTVFKWSKT
ncbi:unnamed protein product, partial [Didymodactylos carnosus]